MRDEAPRDPAAEPPRPSRRASHYLTGLLLLTALSGAAVVAVPYLRRRLDPGPRPVALLVHGIERGLRDGHRPKSADKLAAACATPSCGCILAALRSGMDADIQVQDLVEASGAPCGKEPAMPGLRAESLVRAGRPEGAAEAQQVLARNARDPYARYAIALDAHHRHRVADAIVEAQTAADEGRGAPARILAGLIAYQLGRLDYASEQFHQALVEDPESLQALFNIGVAAQASNRYKEARDSYLEVTRRDPTNRDARYNLALLTHSVGADDEARHHLEKFAALNPSADALRTLKTLLATPVPAQPVPVPPVPGQPPPSGQPPPGQLAPGQPPGQPFPAEEPAEPGPPRGGAPSGAPSR